MQFKSIIKKFLYNFWPSYRQGKIVEWRVDSLRAMVKNELTLMDRKYQMLFWYLYNNPGETIEETKFRFFKMLPPATDELREYQLKNLELLKKLNKICKENNLFFWLEGGTLLGAVRHSGFIPWDDDIDVNMWQKDMDILKNILSKDGEIIFRNKFNFYLNCIVPGIEYKDDRIGWVDIFPMKTVNSRKLGFEETKKYINVQCFEMKKELRKKLVRKPENLEFLDMNGEDVINIQSVNKIMDCFLERLPESKEDDCCYRSLTALNSPSGADLFYLKDVIPFKECQFEDDIYFIPKDSDLWLNTYYGDYLRVPLNISPKHFK